MSVKCKEILLKSSTKEALETEIMYEIATAKVDKAELVKVDMELEHSEKHIAENAKLISYLIRTLKSMKSDGRIQFFATEDSFAKQTTEAVFLINKYPQYFEIGRLGNGEKSIYVKI